MIILGIDPGFDRVGIAVLKKERGTETLLYSACFTTDRTADFIDRLAAVGGEIGRVIEAHSPDTLAIENLFLSNNQKTAMRVAEARGAIIYEAARRGLSVHEYTPLQIKSALTGYGKATKDQVTFMAGKILTLDLSSKIDDECDAIAIALTHSATIRL